MKEKKEQRTYEGEVLSVLAFEFRSDDQPDSERKIKRRLREKKLGAYDQERIDALRAFKNDVLREVSHPVKSKFWLGPDGRKYADMKDWNFEGLKQYFERSHSNIPEDTVGAFLPYAIYLYYLR